MHVLEFFIVYFFKFYGYVYIRKFTCFPYMVLNSKEFSIKWLPKREKGKGKEVPLDFQIEE